MTGAPPELCGRCAREIQPGAGELCFFCEGPICEPCWEEFGWCPHPGADDWQAKLRDAPPAERARMMAALPPIGKPAVKRPRH